MSDEPKPALPIIRGGWIAKFGRALRGILESFTGDPSFRIHLPMAIAVLVVAAIVKSTLHEWALLILCIAVVMAAETANTGLEAMARAVDANFNPDLRKALDAGSGAVLVSAIGASAVGILLLGYRAGILVGWW